MLRGRGLGGRRFVGRGVRGGSKRKGLGLFVVVYGFFYLSNLGG